MLLGSSGCGKSTLLNCIAGLLDVTDGEIWIKDKNVTWAEPKDRGIGMVFQSYALYPQMTVKGNLTFGLKNQRLPKDEIEKRVARAASILQIEPLLDRKPAALSGGQRQRVAIGRALVRDVDVFLFDEPLSNLDAKLRTDLRVEIKRLHNQLKNTMIYVTHDQVEAMTLADRIAIMSGGVILQFACPKEIYATPGEQIRRRFHRLAVDELPRRHRRRRHLPSPATAAIPLERLRLHPGRQIRRPGLVRHPARACHRRRRRPTRDAVLDRSRPSNWSSRWAPTPWSGRASPASGSASWSTARWRSNAATSSPIGFDPSRASLFHKDSEERM